ncbi:hypothetical protein BpHYR1_012914 [Brachionus plicatilis]|uniref:Uncharacterized protein n=1 Tax=Brachionus plicatilis TaxID=10195 RepID=A0A3M7P8K1_BRAPC|nr:hypothetical protein BpHYR1_012914 [Brachionus plicatilis]
MRCSSLFRHLSSIKANNAPVLSCNLIAYLSKLLTHELKSLSSVKRLTVYVGTFNSGSGYCVLDLLNQLIGELIRVHVFLNPEPLNHLIPISMKTKTTIEITTCGIGFF